VGLTYQGGTQETLGVASLCVSNMPVHNNTKSRNEAHNSPGDKEQATHLPREPQYGIPLQVSRLSRHPNLLTAVLEWPALKIAVERLDLVPAHL
jgi:hypothetical protein